MVHSRELATFEQDRVEGLLDQANTDSDDWYEEQHPDDYLGPLAHDSDVNGTAIAFRQDFEGAAGPDLGICSVHRCPPLYNNTNVVVVVFFVCF